MKPATVLITGASSGIGAALAREAARAGHTLVLTARSETALSALAAETGGAGRAQVIPCDLGEPGAAARLWAEVEARGLVIDVLVNNAGMGGGGAFQSADPARLTAMVMLNVLALTELARLAVAPMVARGSGRILNVASTAAFQPGPTMAVYCATKAYVLSLSEAMADDLRGTGVSVTALCPGPTHTNFATAADVEGNALFSGKMLPVMSAEAVARFGWQAAMAGRRVAIPGLVNRLLACSAGMTPRFVSNAVGRKLLAPGH